MNNKWDGFWKFIFILIINLLLIGAIIAYIGIGIKYANTPVNELPAWYVWLYLKGGK